MSFYADLGARMLVVIDRDSRAVEVFVLSRNRYLPQAAKAGGWHAVNPLRLRLRVNARSSPPLLEAALDRDGVAVRVE